jgi:hypothetical protein
MKFTNSLRTSLYTAVGALLLTLSSFAQAPEQMSYQAVIRGANNALVTNQQVGMQISILQGSTAVYEETQTPTSNTNGLVSLEIGTGTVTSGSFTAIDWSADTYFIKTETDPTGGTTYTITGTSQLLSVPFALYAKTSGSATPGPQGEPGIQGEPGAIGVAGTNGTNGTQGIQGEPGITAVQASAITANTGKVGITTVQVNSIIGNNAKTGITTGQSNAILTNTAKQGISAIQASAIIDNTTKFAFTSHAIGDSYGGGIVFFVYDGGQHGLIVATEDQSTGIRWYGGSYTNTGAKADGIGAGLKNTAIIIANQRPVEVEVEVDVEPFAATVCNEYSVTVDGVTYGDWYLPSKYELNLLYLQRIAVGTSLIHHYWSSTEYDINRAWHHRFSDNNQNVGNNKAYTVLYVRAIRAF